MKILVIGGTNIDINATSDQEIVAYDSNIGSIEMFVGGVAKNIAENLARLDLDVSFLTILGNDHYGKIAKNYFKELKLNLIVGTSKIYPTPIYLAVFDHNKDLEVGVNDMKALVELNGEFIRKNVDFKAYDLVLLDSNLSHETLEYIFYNCDKPIFAEAISVNKVKKLVPFLSRMHAIKCNMLEALAITDKTEKDGVSEVIQAIADKGVKEVYVTDGGRGSYLLKDGKLNHLHSTKANIVNTTGAGDAFFSGVIYAKALGKDELKYGNALAKITLESNRSNNPNLNRKLLESVVLENEIRH